MIKNQFSLLIILNLICQIVFAKSDLEVTDVWSRDGIRYRHLLFDYHLDFPTEVDWTIGAVVQKQLQYNLEQEYQQLALVARGNYVFNNQYHQLQIRGGFFPAAIQSGLFPIDTLGLKAAGFSVSEVYQFFPSHDFIVKGENYWLSDDNIKKQLSVGYQYRCNLFDWCRIGYRAEDLRMGFHSGKYWSPLKNLNYGPMFEIGKAITQGLVVGMNVQTRSTNEDNYLGSSSSLALSLTKYESGQQLWRLSAQEGRTKSDLNQWQGIEFHLEYNLENP